MGMTCDLYLIPYPEIQWTYDCPSLHRDGKVPILDLKVWSEGKKILYQFYKKEVASPFVVLARSALPERTKRDTLFMEGMRRLVNCSVDLPWEDKAKFLSDFSNAMRISGNGIKYRSQVIKGAINMYNDLINERGGQIHRTYREIKTKKAAQKGAGKDNWFITKEVSNVLSVPITAGSKLKKAMVQEIGGVKGPDGGLTKVVEKSGVRLTAGLCGQEDGPCMYADAAGQC